MIRYTLTCELDHEFEGWFRNSDDFDAQKEKSLISCPVCGSNHVEKKLMAPAVSTARSKEMRVEPGRVTGTQDMSETPVPKPASGGTNEKPVQQAALMPQDVRQKEVLEALRTLRKRMVEASDYVGKDFPEEARRMHYGEAEERNIYGESSLEEAKALLEEGIDILPLPSLPDEKN